MPARLGDEPTHIKRAAPGDCIVMVGGRIGKDGIHGATFSSVELSEVSPSSAVQIGDPITQKNMFDFLLEARDRQLYTCITDNGAGGLSSSVGEMAQLSNGCELHLERAPLKYAGLDPWEILLSESQERMTLAVPPQQVEAFLALAARRDVEATVLGTFTDTGLFHVLYDGRTVALLDMDFLHHGLPEMRLAAHWQPPHHPEPTFPCPTDLSDSLLRMLGRLNICSKEWVIRQYDHEVQGMSVIKPLVGKANDGPSDAAVLRPLLDSMEGVIVANGICPRYSDIDTYHMVAGAIDEAIRNVIAVGGSLGHITCPESDLLALCYGKIEAVIDTTSVCACQSVCFGWGRKGYKLDGQRLECLKGHEPFLFSKPSRTDRFIDDIGDLVVPDCRSDKSHFFRRVVAEHVARPLCFSFF
jgi:phosphoribosylformylglycinamidine synthase